MMRYRLKSDHRIEVELKERRETAWGEEIYVRYLTGSLAGCMWSLPGDLFDAAFEPVPEPPVEDRLERTLHDQSEESSFLDNATGHVVDLQEAIAELRRLRKQAVQKTQ